MLEIFKKQNIDMNEQQLDQMKKMMTPETLQHMSNYMKSNQAANP